jgi:hypothetical protein
VHARLGDLRRGQPDGCPAPAGLPGAKAAVRDATTNRRSRKTRTTSELVNRQHFRLSHRDPCFPMHVLATEVVGETLRKAENRINAMAEIGANMRTPPQLPV